MTPGTRRERRDGALRRGVFVVATVLATPVWLAGAERTSDHWAFRPVERPALPAVEYAEWVRNPIDRFVLARLEKAGLTPSREAERAVLLRRLSLDLLGLAPRLEEIEDFASDAHPGACERLVERLLASPRFGERWGRHWLDQARYADSNGYTNDGPRSMWPYRDWVIRAINADMPFDRFTIEQLAGDLLPDAAIDQLVATGFHRNTLINSEGGTDPEQFRVEAVVDRVHTTSQVWLGLTIACAQCHEHKFDPIGLDEYYGFYAFFNNCEDRNSVSPQVTLPAEDEEARLAALDAQLAALEASVAGAGGADGADGADSADSAIREELERIRQERKKLLASFARVMVLRERENRRETHIHIRGDFLRPGDVVEPGVPAVLPPLEARGDRADRLDLARWLVSPRNPLTARVTVNRIWMRLFGIGLVETENDFGTQGELPTHPELLDFLASEFVARKWSVKDILRLIVTSATYRQSSAWRAATAAADPRNRLLARQSRVRVEAEIVRDLMLSACGVLSARVGGPGVHPPQPPGVYDFTQHRKSWQESRGEDRHRRGLYTFFYRSAPYPMLSAFDAPNFNTTCTRRRRSNTPLQALTLANSIPSLEAAQYLAGRVLRAPLHGEDGGDDAARLRRLWRLAVTRAPHADELRLLGEFLAAQRRAFEAVPAAAAAWAPRPAPGGMPPHEGAAWTAAARVVLNTDAFVMRE